MIITNIQEELQSQQLQDKTIFDPFQVTLTFSALTRQKLHWLTALWRDLDVYVTVMDRQYRVLFNIYQFQAFYQQYQQHFPDAKELTTLKTIWQAHQLWWRGQNFALNLTTKPVIYDILNTSPDSFYDGGALNTVDDVLRRVAVDLENGATILEIGGQTTRPGFKPITPEVEIERVIPEIKAIKAHFPEALIAVDTYKTPVMQAALDAGADIINDVNGFRDDPEKLTLLKTYQPAVLTMHENRGKAYTEDLTSNVQRFFKTNLQLLLDAGLPYEAIALDQGVGYSANADNIQDFAFMRTLDQLNIFQRPTMVAVSNKGFYGKLLGLSKEERLLPTIVSETAMIQQGGRLIRVHDVKATADMIKLLDAINNSFLIDKENDEITRA
ncbi:dihydropteroate synthase [Agrilactobacillus yilanensis]|uniref:Dihydropteroate synthase n=1 Tax=Agrilactobacillus yilanensis TaxID=2485997 RepID=A0ABW4J544_9LACO|nr:dihydropteroate synthase [Agrilactobacillus yilanensis]